MNLAGEAYQWGADLISNLVSGIQSGIQWVADAVTGVADRIRAFLHFSVPDEGPLTDMESWMPDMMSQLAAGIANGDSAVSEAVRSLVSGISDIVKEGLLSVGEIFRSGWETAIGALGNVGPGILEGVRSVFGEIGSLASGAWNAVQTATVAAWQNVRNALSSAWGNISATAVSVWQGVTSALPRFPRCSPAPTR